MKKRKLIKILIFVVLFIFMSSGSSTLATVSKQPQVFIDSDTTIENIYTWIVDPDPGQGDFTNIQDAIDAASPGDIIYVYSGEYSNFEIRNEEKNSLTILGQNLIYPEMTSADWPYINGNFSDSVVKIMDTFGIKIEGFYIYNSNDEVNYGGVHISRSYNCIISNNKIFTNYYGIFIYESSNIDIHLNTITGNINGIKIEKHYFQEPAVDDFNYISLNHVYSHLENGIVIEEGIHNIIIRNNIHNNAYDGVRIYDDTIDPNLELNLVIQNNLVDNQRNPGSNVRSFSNFWYNNYIKGVLNIIFGIPPLFPSQTEFNIPFGKIP